MANMYQAILTTPEDKKVFIDVQKVEQGQYRVVGAQDLRSLDGYTLAFDPTTPSVSNLDTRSDSYSCFRLSEAFELKGPALKFEAGTFYVQDLTQLQAGLNRLRGRFISSAEY